MDSEDVIEFLQSNKTMRDEVHKKENNFCGGTVNTAMTWNDFRYYLSSVDIELVGF